MDFGYGRTQQSFNTRNAYSGLLPAGFWLPSLDVDLGLMDDVKARFSYSRSIAHPPLGGRTTDPLAVFDVTTTDNAEVGNLHGLELALQHLFGGSGFGVQANATLVRGDVNANPDILNQGFTLPGLSDSDNLSVFFENANYSVRLAYNWRDRFLSGFDAYGAPVFNEKYQQLDFNATWYTSDNLSVFFEAINLTDEVQRIYVRYPEQFLRGNNYGARYNIGARYTFR